MQYISIERQLDSYGQSARARSGQPGHGRLAAFAAAAGAGLAMTGAADASIVYTAVNTVLSNQQPNVPAGQTSVSSIQFAGVDFNKDGNNEFAASLFWRRYSNNGLSSTTGQASLKQIRTDGGVMLHSNRGVERLARGTPINPTPNHNRWFALFTQFIDTAGDVAHDGNWPVAATGFAGVSFMLGGNSYLGWIRLSWNDLLGTGGTPGADGFPDQLTLVDYAWNDTPGGAINAGDGIPEVPVPPPLALLAIGAAGIAATRRCRTPVARA